MMNRGRVRTLGRIFGGPNCVPAGRRVSLLSVFRPPAGISDRSAVILLNDLNYFHTLYRSVFLYKVVSMRHFPTECNKIALINKSEGKEKNRMREGGGGDKIYDMTRKLKRAKNVSS